MAGASSSGGIKGGGKSLNDMVPTKPAKQLNKAGRSTSAGHSRADSVNAKTFGTEYARPAVKQRKLSPSESLERIAKMAEQPAGAQKIAQALQETPNVRLRDKALKPVAQGSVRESYRQVAQRTRPLAPLESSVTQETAATSRKTKNLRLAKSIRQSEHLVREALDPRPEGTAAATSRASFRTETELAWRRALHEMDRSKQKISEDQPLVAAGGKSKKNGTGEKAFLDLIRAFGNAGDVDTPEKLDALVRGLGYEFSPHDPQGTSVVYRHGNNRLKLKPFDMAGFVGFEVKFRGTDKHGRKQKLAGVLVGGSLMSKAAWQELEGHYRAELTRFATAYRQQADKSLPTSFAGLKALETLGRPVKEQAQREAQQKEIGVRVGNLSRRLQTLRQQGKAPEQILVMFTGPDAAGKSSTGAVIMEALKDAGFSVNSTAFRAPTVEESQHPRMWRYEKALPQKGQAMFWDRGPDDPVYAAKNAGEFDRMAQENIVFEKNTVAAPGTFVFKVELFANRDKQAAVLGKRLARRFIAQEILDSRGTERTLTADAEGDLRAVASKVDLADFRAFGRYDAVQKRFLRLVSLTNDVIPWNVVDATQRHPARLDLLTRFTQELDAYAASREASAK